MNSGDRRVVSRRQFVRTSAAVTAGLAVPYWFSAAESVAALPENEKPVCGTVGLGGIWNYKVDFDHVKPYLNVVALCDVDRKHLAAGNAKMGGRCATFGDYRRILDRQDVQVVHVCVPDHWHVKIAIEALRAGKDVYCEKPLTYTIDEGKLISKVVQQTGRILQVGTQQRTEFDQRFLKAVAIVRDGRIGKVKRATCGLGAPRAGGPFAKTAPPPELDWNRWLGPAPRTDYIAERCHDKFRWWYEYSGGKITDWGAHHVDIAQWGLGYDRSGPRTVEPVSAEFPVPLKDGYPTRDDSFNTPIKFEVKCTFAGGEELIITHGGRNGILFEGETGRLFVNRDTLSGKPVEQLRDRPLPDGAITKLYKGKRPYDHIGNFVECVKDRSEPVSDVFTHHRAVTTCHLANIALRLGRKIEWDPQKQEILADDQARAMQWRAPRDGYEIKG